MSKQYAQPFTIALAAGLLLAGCGADPTTQPATDDGPAAEQRREVLQMIGDETLSLYTSFDAETVTLDAAVDAWAQEPSDANRVAAQDAWKQAITAWQRAEVTQFGPAGAMSAVEGGEDIRDRIYSWPLTNACRIDQELASQGYDDADFATERINVKGLDALEYLLFVDGTDNACSANSVINTDGSWDALDAEELTARRAAYAAVVTDELVATSDELLTWWSAEGNNFEAELASAGAGSAVYPSSQEALNAVSDALFYLEKETKDMKVAPPVGLTVCVESACPELRESQFANVSLDNIRANLDGFAAIYFAGFDPLLRKKGADALADELETKLVAAQAEFAELDASMEIVLGDDRDGLLSAHEALRDFVLVFRTQFLSVLDLELPLRAEGDND